MPTSRSPLKHCRVQVEQAGKRSLRTTTTWREADIWAASHARVHGECYVTCRVRTGGSWHR